MQVKMAVVTRAVRIMAMMSTVTETVLSLAPIGDACLGPAFIAKFGLVGGDSGSNDSSSSSSSSSSSRSSRSSMQNDH